MMEEECLVKEVLQSLREYLQKNLRIDKDFISRLQAAGLLGDSDVDRICSSLTQGSSEALRVLLDHIAWFYDEGTLKVFCALLQDYSKPAKPRLGDIANRIREEIQKHKSGPLHQSEPHQQDGVPISTDSGPPSSPPATQGEPTPTVPTMDERSQKIEEIVDMYRSESTKVSLPEIPELEDDFDDIMGSLNAELSLADPKVICKLQGMLSVKYRRYIHGVKPVELPSISNTASGLYQFIAEKSTTYEILLIHHAVEKLNCEDLKRSLESYESKLAEHLRRTLKSYQKRKVTLPLQKNHTHLAVSLSKEQILLSLVLRIKEYLMKYLQLETAVFEGFVEGCTVLFFSILRVDAVLLSLKVLSHSAELKRMFDITHLVVFDYFACDLEKATMELPDKHHPSSSEVKHEINATMMTLPTVQKERDSDEFSLSTLERGNEAVVSLKEEIATLKTDLGEKQVQVKELEEKLNDTENRLESAVKELKATREKLSDAENRLPVESTVKELETTKENLSDVENSNRLNITLEEVETTEEVLGDTNILETTDKSLEEAKMNLRDLSWREEPDALKGMTNPTAVYVNGKIFVSDRWQEDYQQFLLTYHVVVGKIGQWSQLRFYENYEMRGFTLVADGNHIHSLGGAWRKGFGEKEEEYSSEVFSLVSSDDDLKWSNTLPPLNIGREDATSTSFDSFIVVAGGSDRNQWLASVEVLDSSLSSSTWWEICDLPVESFLMQCTVTHDELFIGCGEGTGDTVYTAKLSAVKESLYFDEDSESSVSPESFWSSLPKTPLERSSLVSVNNCLLTLGGQKLNESCSSIYLYDSREGHWTEVSDIKGKRFSPAVVCASENKRELFVLCGYGAETSVESCELLY